MTIQKYSDSERYLSCRNGINFYYFGEGCIADYYGNSIAFLDCDDIKIATLCKNGIREDELIQKLNSSFLRGEHLSKRVMRLKKKGVLVDRDVPSEVAISFYGEKGHYFPKDLTIELTDTCNFFCPFCYKNAKKDGTFISDKVIKDIDSIINGKVHYITLSGGEPTIHPHYMKYIDIFSEYADVSMITNGSLVYEHDISILRKLKHIQFSIYGCNDEEYKRTTGCADGFTKLCKSVEVAKNNNIDIALALTLCELTVDRMEEFVNKCIQMGVGTLRMGLARSFGRGAYLNEKIAEFDGRTDELLGKMRMLKKKYRNDIYIDFAKVNVEHIDTHEDLVLGVYRGTLDCGNGSESLVISQTGEIRPCAYLPESLFSVGKQDGLKEHVAGNFHIDLLEKSIKTYSAELSSKEYDQLCWAMKDFCLKKNCHNCR